MKKTISLLNLNSILLLTFILNYSLCAQESIVNDSLYKVQERIFNLIQVQDAWKITKGDKSIKIGIIDNGFDFYHPDLIGQLIPGYFVSNAFHSETYENIAHGTMVSSIIGARLNNKTGMSGIAPNCTIITASTGCIEHTYLKLQQKYFIDNPDSNLNSFRNYIKSKKDELNEFGINWSKFVVISTAECIVYLVNADVKVINISNFYSKKLCKSLEAWEQLENAFRYASRKGVLIIIGAGNNAKEIDDYPGNKDSIIIVGASTINDKPWYKETNYNGQIIKQGSNFGSSLTVMAPPDSIVVCIPSDKRYYNSNNGPLGKTEVQFEGLYDVLAEGATSLAVPMVTSLAALIYCIKPEIKFTTVRELIIKGCDDIGSNGYDIFTGYGRINYKKTINLALDSK